ncbi:uncharacterized protein BO97DRAFT_475504 [Aspergillus homomorphus CBS 101889]|uniref:Decapping nuclease n=1 Tax=Aspergillus homomorphus (strain CBS 101889) TaxID=1450537 RepID=A0A395I7J7_ASPHC|nr:hypothetical protein BO97DRAFT_475504 [Aspergillus homomorphus CBS 101889]RAL15896.1 hypothetical protein BO97DRAFT_475504 [Aspergillus homomorphus CBS 101889]
MSSNIDFLRRTDRSYPRRGRDGWRGGRSQRSSVPRAPPPPLGEIIATLEYDDLQDDTTKTHHPARITDTQYLTSYNWVRGGSGIIVPGEPPQWTPRPEPSQLQEDSGDYFRDLNAARHPNYPLEPMIRAILADKPDYRVQDLDVVACASTLGNLLRFARGDSLSFRMLVEVIGNTVFFIRRENSPWELITDVHGYGHTFPEAYTTWTKDVRTSESHQRLINYEFANMNVLMRFEADGFLPELVPKSGLAAQENPIHGESDAELEDVLASITAATITTNHSSATIDDRNPSALEISKAGRYIPQCAIFDLKTRSARKSKTDILQEQMSRLWIRQVPHLVLAFHNTGRFDDVRVMDVQENLKNWEESQQPSLQRFAILMQMVTSFVRSAEVGKLEVEHNINGEEKGVLNFRIPGGTVNSVLPPDLIYFPSDISQVYCIVEEVNKI